MGSELICYLRPRLYRHEQIAPANVNLIGKRQRHRVAGACLVDITVRANDARDPAGDSALRNHDRLAAPYAAGRDASSEPAEIVARPVYPLHRAPKGFFLSDA